MLTVIDAKEAIALAKALRKYDELKSKLKFMFFEPYKWQLKFYMAGLKNKQRMLMAANRVGKTQSSCVELAYHLTGIYPEWWNGITFDFPINAWALGVSGEQIRDVLQNELFGTLDRENFSGNLIPTSMITDITRSMTPKLAKDVHVKHKSGGESVVSFKSYSQGQNVLMGSSVDYALIDEEPQDPEIYPQVLTRTATGNKGKGGYTVLSFTPENGSTPLVCQFMNNLQDGQNLINVTWDDAPHLTEETKVQLLAAIPEYQRDMRSKGIPLMGSGQVFPVDESEIKCDPIPIPDHWARIKGVDFGHDHPMALACCAWDRDNDIFYVYDSFRRSYKGKDEDPLVSFSDAINKRKDWIPVSWPHDGLQHEKLSGVQIAQQFKDEGKVNMLPYRATFEDGSSNVEPGIMEMYSRMKSGKFKVFNTLSEWFEEFRLYHRKDGKINKINDDLISATRYALMMRRYAEVEEVEDTSYRPKVKQSWY